MSDSRRAEPSALTFWISPVKPAPGQAFLELDNDGIVNGYPGYWEIANPVPGTAGRYFIIYLFETGNQSYSLATCWDGFVFDLVQEWLTNPKTAKGVGAVVRREWPLFFRLSENGSRGDLRAGALVEVNSASGPQWCVMTVFSGIQFSRIEQLYEEPPAATALQTVWESSKSLLQETMGDLSRLSEIVVALGESDRARRQKAQERVDHVMNALGYAKDVLSIIG